MALSPEIDFLKNLTATKHRLTTVIMDYIANQNAYSCLRKTQLLTQAEKLLNLITEVMQTTRKRTATTFLYTSIEQQIRMQNLLIDIGMHLIQFADELDEALKGKYY